MSCVPLSIMVTIEVAISMKLESRVALVVDNITTVIMHLRINKHTIWNGGWVATTTS